MDQVAVLQKTAMELLMNTVEMATDLVKCKMRPREEVFKNSKTMRDHPHKPTTIMLGRHRGSPHKILRKQ